MRVSLGKKSEMHYENGFGMLHFWKRDFMALSPACAVTPPSEVLFTLFCVYNVAEDCIKTLGSSSYFLSGCSLVYKCSFCGRYR